MVRAHQARACLNLVITAMMKLQKNVYVSLALSGFAAKNRAQSGIEAEIQIMRNNLSQD